MLGLEENLILQKLLGVYLFMGGLSTPVVDSVYIYIYVKNAFAYAENDDNPKVRYPTDVMSAEIRSQLEASCVSSYTEDGLVCFFSLMAYHPFLVI